MRRDAHNILQDVGIIILSIFIAILLVETDSLAFILDSSKELGIISSFIAGLFFTSVFTTAPSIAALGEISLLQSPYLTAAFGALGAVVGDLVIFRFIKDRVSQDIMELLGHQGGLRRLKTLFKLKIFRRLSFLLGGLIIASPLPDELGITLLGLAKMKIGVFIPLSLIFNFLGILAIGLVAKAL